MDTACPRCESTKTVSGRCLGHLDAGAGFVFRPDDLSFFSIMGTDIAIGDRATACIECGLMWLEVPADKLKRIIARKGKAELKERLELQ